MTLAPGVIVTNSDQFSVTTSLSATNQVINGHRSDQNHLTIDGAYNMDAGGNASLINNLSPDFIQEVKIQTSNFSAEYGRMSGGAFNVITKNGTNQLHGAAFEHFRNDRLDARNFFSPEKTELRFNDFGYDVGGPILRNKLFFFAGEEWKILRQQQAPVRETLPSSAELAGNFSAVKTQLVFPGTKTPIPGNQIASLITPDGRAIANVYRLAAAQAASYTDQAVSNNTIFQGPNPLDYREDLVRIDYHISDKHNLYGRWIQDLNSIYLPMGTGSSTDLPSTPEIRNRPGRSVLLSETWLPTPTIVNEARVSASWNKQRYSPAGTNWMRSTVGFTFPQLYAGGEYDNGIPDVTISGFATFKGPNGVLISPATDIQAGDTLSIVRGPHLIKAGALVIRERKNQNGRSLYAGSVAFSTTANPRTTGNALADALLGNFSTYTEASYDPFGFFRFTQPEAFLQDSWRVSRKLSLDLGIRYQYMEPLYSTANNLANFVPALYDPRQAVQVTSTGALVPGVGNIFNGLIRAGGGVPRSEAGRVPNATSPQVLAVPAGAPRGLYDSHNTFAPRLGFAFAATPKTVLRGGFGLFYDRVEGNITFSTLNSPPFTQTAQYQNGNLANIAGQSITPAPWGNITAIDPNLKVPYSEQFSLGIQRELPLQLFSEITYVGTLGRHLLREPDINQPGFAQLSADAALPTAQQPSINSLRPYAGYASIFQYRSDSTSNYHALQAYVSRRVGAITFTAGYTFSKVLTDSSSQTDNPENYADRHYNYGPATFDRRHAFVGTFIWSLPALSHQNRAMRAIAGSWQLSGIVRAQSGPLHTVTASIPPFGTRRVDYLGGPVLVDNPGPNAWVNKAAFGRPPITRYGNSGVGIVPGPGLQSYDVSLKKFFHLTDRVSLRFQADVFNVPNLTNFNTLSVTESSGNFGTISTAFPGRQLQFGLKLAF